MASLEISREPRFSESKNKIASEPLEPSAPIETVENVSDLQMSYPVITDVLVYSPNCPVLTTEVSSEMQSDIPNAATGLPNKQHSTIESIVSRIENPKGLGSGSSPKITTVELELEKALLKKEQLYKEIILSKKEFKVQNNLLNTEIEIALARLGSLENIQLPSNSAYSNTVPEPIKSDNGRFYPSCPQLEEPLNNFGNSYLANGSQTDFRINNMPASVSAVSSALGLQQLSPLDCVTIRQLRSRDLDETYEVVAPEDGHVIFRANVVIGVLGQRRTLRLEFIDNDVKQIAIFKYNPGGYMELIVCGQLSARVKKMPTLFKPMLMIHDAQCRPMLKIKGPSITEHKFTFKVQSIGKRTIGWLDKSPVLETQHHGSAHAIAQFPSNLNVHYKLAIIATNFLILDKNTVQTRDRRLEALISSGNRMGHQYRLADYPTRSDY